MGTVPTVLYANPVAEVITRADAAEILGVTTRRVTKMRGVGGLRPATTPHRRSGLYWREQVAALSWTSALSQDATSEELMAARTSKGPRPFVDTEGAAEILGVSVQYVARLAAQGRLPWLPTGRTGGGPRGCTGGRRLRLSPSSGATLTKRCAEGASE
jgi:hypothetical protein